jgi:hypothetical protein
MSKMNYRKTLVFIEKTLLLVRVLEHDMMLLMKAKYIDQSLVIGKLMKIEWLYY